MSEISPKSQVTNTKRVSRYNIICTYYTPRAPYIIPRYNNTRYTILYRVQNGREYNVLHKKKKQTNNVIKDFVYTI